MLGCVCWGSQNGPILKDDFCQQIWRGSSAHTIPISWCCIRCYIKLQCIIYKVIHNPLSFGHLILINIKCTSFSLMIPIQFIHMYNTQQYFLNGTANCTQFLSAIFSLFISHLKLKKDPCPSLLNTYIRA